MGGDDEESEFMRRLKKGIKVPRKRNVAQATGKETSEIEEDKIRDQRAEKRRKRKAEYSRKYRAKKKLTTIDAKEKKSDTERIAEARNKNDDACRHYYVRKKEDIRNLQLQHAGDREEESNVAIKRRKNTEYVRKYRKKILEEASQVQKNMDGHQIEEILRKIAHQRDLAKKRSQKYRDNKRANALLQTRTIHETPIAGPLTAETPILTSSGHSQHNSQIINLSEDINEKIIDGKTVEDCSLDCTPHYGSDSHKMHNSINNHNLEQIIDKSQPQLHQQRLYSSFKNHSSAHREFKQQFIENDFGHVCDVCDRLWFKNDLKSFTNNDYTPYIQLIRQIVPVKGKVNFRICSKCIRSIQKNKTPKLAVHNGFTYPPIPDELKNFPLDLVSERLISPRIPFLQIRRLRNVHGQFGICSQVINVPVEIGTMVHTLPRDIDDDHCINVHIKEKKIRTSSFVHRLVRGTAIKAWLKYLIDTPLYVKFNIKIDDKFFNNGQHTDNSQIHSLDDESEVSEHISIDESLLAQQQTLMWNEDVYLSTTPEERDALISVLFDEHAEELSFPGIYFGHFRKFREEISVTSFMMASSELRRSDRRGVTPNHLLYMAMKIMIIRVLEQLRIASKHAPHKTNISKEEIESEDYTQGCIESNIAFPRSVLNSTWYWSERKEELFAMIRQLGKPTVFFSIAANEIGWNKLLQLLYKLRYKKDISEIAVEGLHYIEKSTLINEDAVTCTIYFNKLVDTIMKILQSKRYSPFKQYRVLHYFKRIEFQHRGTPHAHILAWLDNAPKDALLMEKPKAVELIDALISVSTSEASGSIKLQTHKHTISCYENITTKKAPRCRFEAPFLPSKNTLILTPMTETEDGFNTFRKRYTLLKQNLENDDYRDFDELYEKNNILTDDDYINIIRAGINRPSVFIKRQPQEKWHNPFNPFILNVVKSTTDFQFITDEYSCAGYLVEYVNKKNRGFSNLQRKIIETMNDHPEFDIVEITKNISVNILNHMEITTQEAAWYLLREPMSKTSTIIVYIPTVWPTERQRIKKTMKDLSEMDWESTDTCKENWFDKYEQRPEHLKDISLANFVSKYYKNNKEPYALRDEPRIIRYRNYDMAADFNEYKREMVTLHIPFRNEETEILAEMKFISTYDEHDDFILQARKEFESNIDVAKIKQICRVLCSDETLRDGDEIQSVGNRVFERNPFEDL